MKRSLVCVLSVLALALAMPVLAQSEQSASGTVVSSSSSQLVISTADGRQMTFMMDNNTNRPSSLAQGSSVTVRYHDMNGTFHAANVAAGTGSTAGASAGNTNTTTSTTGTSSPTGTTGVTGSTAGTTADPAGDDARTPDTTAQDATGTAGTTTGTTRAMADDQDTGTGRLPATASPLPLMGLSGLLALGGGLAVRAFRRRR